MQKRCDEVLHQARAEVTKAFSEGTSKTDVTLLQSQIGELEKRVNAKFGQIDEQQKQDSEHKLMSISMLNILDERVNGVDTRLVSMEKLTKEVHSIVQKYKAKGNFEKILTDRFEALLADNLKFQDLTRAKIQEVGGTIEQKCKKLVNTLFEHKISKLETDIENTSLNK